jgi:hypothetical protein
MFHQKMLQPEAASPRDVPQKMLQPEAASPRDVPSKDAAT